METKGESETPSLSSAMMKTTTISTIAVQSGKARIVIALLHCGNWLQLKILEITPELTKLGSSLAEALELQKAHDEVLRQLQKKQSPVEELLRQADQLIAPQKPRAEVYAAMAETLGRAWRDINYNLELRKHILDLNVEYHVKAAEFFDKIKTLEESCSDTLVPIDIEAVKQFLTTIHDLRRTLLESLMAALQAGNSLLGKLKALGAEGTPDSRTDHIRQSINKALSQVQTWLDELHVKRQDVEAIFNRRKLQLEQCLALAILAADLRELEDCVNNCRNRLINADQLGDSAASTQLLLHENTNLLPEAQLLQEKALKITKATEQLLASGCFAGVDATKQSYAILSMTSDYMTELQNRNSLLERVRSFFELSQTAFNNLDQLEIQLTSSNFKTISPKLTHLHTQCSKSIEEMTAGPITEGYSILQSVGRGSTGTDGVKRIVEDLENVKIRLNALFVAHREENLRINRAVDDFLETYSSIQIWLSSIAEAFLQSHQDMGNDLPTANNFMDLHRKLLTDLQDKGNKINSLLLNVLPPIVQYLDDDRKRDIDGKVDQLRYKWSNLKNILRNRLDLGRIYVKFHTEADIVNIEVSRLEDELKSKGSNIDDEILKNLEIKWESLEPLYQSAKNTGLTFINEAKKISEPHLNTNRACACVETVLERLSGRQLQVTRTWQTFQTDLIEKKELMLKLETTIMESSQTINWVTRLQDQLYPVLTTTLDKPNDIANFISNKLDTIFPDIKRAQNEVEMKIKTAEELIAKTKTIDEKALSVKVRLDELNRKLIDMANDYKALLECLVAYFVSIHDFQKDVDRIIHQSQNIVEITNTNRIKSLISEHESSKNIINQNLNRLLDNCDTLTKNILEQEPPNAASQDIEKLRNTLEIERSTWETQYERIRDTLDKQCTFCQFDEDLSSINRSFNSLEQQNQELRKRYGQSIDEAKSSSLAYASFEETIQDLDKKIGEFIAYGESLLSENISHSPLIEKHINELRDRWHKFRKQIQQTRHLIDLSIKYFGLIQEAGQWFKEGEGLLVSIARRSTSVKNPEGAEELLREIATFLRPGEEKQNERIQQITQLAKDIYGPELPIQLENVVDESREMIKSFTLIREELDTLSRNLVRAEQEKLRSVQEQQKAAAKNAAARAEALAFEEARAAAEKKKIAQEVEMKRVELENLEKQRQYGLKAEQEELRLQKEKEEAAAQVIEVPRFTTPLADAIIQEGSKFSFICRVHGNPTPTTTWYKEGVPIQNNPDYQASYEQGICTLTIEETFSDDSGRYTCKANNAAGITETSALLSVKETEPEEQLLPPSFTRLLEPTSTNEGSSFEFHCKVIGNPLPNVQWYKNQECIDYAPGYHITYNNGDAILKIETVYLKDKAEYTCKASNQLGSAQSTANLTVTSMVPTESPLIISPLSNVMARTGQKIKLECEITGTPIPNIVWFHNGYPLEETRELKLQSEGDRATLVIYEAFPKDAGNYKVTATNIAGEVSSVCSVSVKGRLSNETSDSEIASDMEPVKPSIQLPLTDISVTEGSRVRLDCVIVGQPEPEVIWYHDDRPVKESSDFQLLFQGDRCSLVIQEAFPEDAGEYKVVALNSAGEASSKCSLFVTHTSRGTHSGPEKTISIGYSPKFNQSLTDKLVYEGEPVIFEGNVCGEPRPDVKWLLNNSPIAPNDDLKISYDEDGHLKLAIKKVQPQNKGVYTVKAVNEHGEAKCFAQLIVKSSKAPETVEYEEVKSVPVFTETFTDKIAYENSQTKFECIVSGKPKPKIKWLFRGEPINGTNLLVSTSGDWEVLSIPNVTKHSEGIITCIAENEMGVASCAAQLTVHSSSTITLPDSNDHLMDSKFSIKREVHTASSTNLLSSITSSGIDLPEPQVKIHSFSSHSEKTFRQVNQEAPEISESHTVEELLQLDAEQPIIHEKSSSSFSNKKPHGDTKSIQPSTKHFGKLRAPKFTTPLVGKIVDQNSTVILEGIIDGLPTPSIIWTKNGKEITFSEKISAKWEFHKASLEIKDTNSIDAGRYTCTAMNDAGTAISTADLVVRKTIFPPVFGRRLQAQVIKKGDRIIMEVEITGTPEPTITWYKDSVPVEQALTDEYKLKCCGNSHTLVIEKGDLKHSGRFMVRALNSGGEAQSIADIAVFEPTPDTMVEVVKTVVFEDVRKHETLTSAADRISSPSTTKLVGKPNLSFPSVCPKSEMSIFESSQARNSKSEFSTFTEQKLSQQVSKARLEYTAPEIPNSQRVSDDFLEKKMDFEIDVPPVPDLITKSQEVTDEGIETSSITKESSLQYSVQEIEKSTGVNEESPAKKYKKYERVDGRHELPIEVIAEPPSQVISKTESTYQLKEEKIIGIQQQPKEEVNLEPEPPAQIYYSKPVSEITTSTTATSFEQEEEEKINTETSFKFSSQIPPDSSSAFEPPSRTVIDTTAVLDTKSYEQEMNIIHDISSSTSYEKYTRVMSPRPEALEMEKLWMPKKEIERPLSVTETFISEKPTHVRSYSYSETNVPRVHYIANISHCIEPFEKKIDSLFTEFGRNEWSEMNTENIFKDQNMKSSLISKDRVEMKSHPTSSGAYPSMEILTIKSSSVQDISDEVILEPGPPPILDYAQPPKVRRQSYVEVIEQELETKLENVPAKIPPGAVRTIPPSLSPKFPPPPLPPKNEQVCAPPLPAKPVNGEFKQNIIEIIPQHREDKLKLEPFPFKPDRVKPKHMLVGPPPTPSKFIKGKFTDSDYESDFESIRIPPKWQPCASDNEEPSYRKVKPPKLRETRRSKSTEPEPLPPSKFDHPPHFQGPPRPDGSLNYQKRSAQSIRKQSTQHYTKSSVTSSISSPPIKPGTPPLYIEAPSKKLDSPKLKRRTVMDGYMADTDEPFFQQKSIKSETHEVGTNFSGYEYKSENIVQSSQKSVVTTPFIPKVFHHKQIFPHASAAKKELTATPIITNIQTEKREESYEIQKKTEHHSRVQQQSKYKTLKCPPPPSPSKFVKCEFRESDNESDYDKHIPRIWKSSGSEDTPKFRPVRPVLTPTGRKSQVAKTPTPPTEFEEPLKSGEPPRPKFEPIEKPLVTAIPVEISKPEAKSVIVKPKPISVNQTADITRYIPLRPGSPPEIAYTSSPQTVQFYRSTTSMPYHNAVQTESSNKVHFKESTEKCHRTVSLEQSTKVIKFGDKQTRFQLEPYSETKHITVKCPPPTIPKKFVPGQFRESDYESDVENIRIKPKWAPSGSDTEDLHYRPVRPPSSASRSSSVPPNREGPETSTEFDNNPCYKSTDEMNSAVTNTESSSFNRCSSVNSCKILAARSRSHEPLVKRVEIQPGSPPEYGFISDTKFRSKATSVASHHMDNMTQQFKTKTQKFVRDIMNDVEKKSTPKKSILKNGEERDAQVYREDTRAAQYGTKHVDPDTGLIYFKYDFGYEFGIVLPGESKNVGIPEHPRTKIEPPKRTRDIEMPVYHEAGPHTEQQSDKHLRPKTQKTNENIKWEPTSESELSEYEGNARNQGTEKRRMTDTPPSCPSTPINSTKGEVRAPMFITPLRNIAVVSGQNAKFECIVQSETPQNILWSKNGRIIEDSNDYQLYYRNGVCRLSISKAYPEDAGTYTCNATNAAGTASTTAVLDVPGQNPTMSIHQHLITNSPRFRLSGVPSHMYGTYRYKSTTRCLSPEIEFYRRPQPPEMSDSIGK